ncbi:MAG TPA: alpha-ketoglutarate-dependent dioxygenase AlkB [Gammaproteobacteria bacterium]|nr:alpha-ketoglutarate-dependent dioxygenase AlkB [Gammaproteobacteria bacterium]
MQSSLFDNLVPNNDFESHDLGNARIDEYPTAFEARQALKLAGTLINEIPWHQASIIIAGVPRQVPRLQCWMGDAESIYGYSGMRLSPEPWSEAVISIKQRLCDLTCLNFNSVLLNYYRDGKDSVAWHADDEPELGVDPIIASVSLGAERDFQLCPKNSSSRAVKARLKLRNGSLLVMGKGMQNNWLHQVPKANNIFDPRINLTFRNINPTA